MDKLRVGWIGTGVMGSSMAGHLLSAGYPVTVYTRTKAKAQDLLTQAQAGRTIRKLLPSSRMSSSQLLATQTTSRLFF